jgi:hypothetical protein
MIAVLEKIKRNGHFEVTVPLYFRIYTSTPLAFASGRRDPDLK